MKRKPKDPGGRPTKYDAEAATKILNALKAGAFRKVAATWAGIGPRTFREWMAKGKQSPDSVLGSFRRKVLEAETAAEIAVGTRAFKAASEDPAYALAYMRVRWRKRWSPAEKVEVTGKDGRPLVPEADPSVLLEKLLKLEEDGRKKAEKREGE